MGDDAVVTGPELDQMSDEELRRRAPKVAVYSRVTAGHKLRIIRAWKANKAVVAMTGDGVNDAPAIKGADVMKRRPRNRLERITSGGFLGTMLLTGVLTAGVSFGVYLYGLTTETLALARTYAFATLVFAELLRAFGARSETKPVWRVGLLSNLYLLLLVVVLSFTLQVWSHHNALLAMFLKTTFMTSGDCILLVAVSAIPLAVLELVKVSRSAARRKPVTVG